MGTGESLGLTDFAIETVVANRRRVYDQDVEQWLEFRKELWATANDIKFGKGAQIPPEKFEGMQATLARLQDKLGLNVRIEQLKYNTLEREAREMDANIEAELNVLVQQMEQDNSRLSALTGKLKEAYVQRSQLNRMIRSFNSSDVSLRFEKQELKDMFPGIDVESFAEQAAQEIDRRDNKVMYVFRQRLQLSCERLERNIQTKKSECENLKERIEQNRDKWLKLSQKITAMAALADSTEDQEVV